MLHAWRLEGSPAPRKFTLAARIEDSYHSGMSQISRRRFLATAGGASLTPALFPNIATADKTDGKPAVIGIETDDGCMDRLFGQGSTGVRSVVELEHPPGARHRCRRRNDSFEAPPPGADGENGPLARFLAVVGPSGSGKSSVIKAGLIPALRRGGVDGSADWFIAEMTPGETPLQNLAVALLSIAAAPPP